MNDISVSFEIQVWSTEFENDLKENCHQCGKEVLLPKFDKKAYTIITCTDCSKR